MIALLLIANPALLYEEVRTSSAADDLEAKELALAHALRDEDLTVAAAGYYYNVAKNRTNPELLGEALTALAELMEKPHDEEMLDKTLLTESELGRFPPELDGFVWFARGVQDLRDHHVEWAERHFAQISPETPHAARSLYVLGTQRLRRRADAEAVALFRRVRAHPAADRELRNDALLALARILFERGRFAAALDLYDRFESQAMSLERPTLHLERAWALYHLGRRPEAMARLFALDAPSFRDFYAPEVFLLRGLIYRDLCQHVQAKRVVREFRRTFKDALASVRSGTILRDPVLRAAARRQGRLARLAAYAEVIEAERERVGTQAGTLRDHLESIYELAARRTALLLTQHERPAVAAAAADLVELEEQMALLDYELDLELNKRRRTVEPAVAAASSPPRASTARFDFGGEFWTDEIEAYRFVTTDRCVRERAR